MGTYVNPGNESMQSAVSSQIYVDKTGLLSFLNKNIGTENRYFAVSRCRRFGKTMAAGMIDAYYSIGCDSREMFSPYEIAKDPDFEKHLNQYNVVHFDVGSFFYSAGSPEEVIPSIDQTLLKEMLEEFPWLTEEHPANTPKAINLVYKKEKRKFIVVIDEYDCITRDAAENEELVLGFLRYLRGFFKTEESKQFLALGYITGILPIKKVKGESALNMFSEFTMTSPRNMVSYFGFTQKEVEALCRRYEVEPAGIRKWYDGYHMYALAPGVGEEGKESENGSVRLIEGRPMRLWHIYNPNSVVEAFISGETASFWKNTGSFDSLQDFITMNYAGLKEDVVHMLTGGRISVDITSFQNDVTQFKCKDDVLACLIHMGYLGYDAYRKEAFIPNMEVAAVFEACIKTGDWNDLRDALNNSRELLRAVRNMEEEKVARVIAASHQDYASIIDFHDENALATAIMMSFYTARADYHVIRELPSGKGFADIAFIPKQEGKDPAMIVELKWNRSARAALRQIKHREYTGALSDYHGEILLVGINYTKKTKKYTCRIEKWKELRKR